MSRVAAIALLALLPLVSAGAASAATGQTVISFEGLGGAAVENQYASSDGVRFGTAVALGLPAQPTACAHAFTFGPGIHGDSADIACGGVQPEVGEQPNHRVGLGVSFARPRRSVQFTMSSRVQNQVGPVRLLLVVYGLSGIALERRDLDLPAGHGFIVVNVGRPGAQIAGLAISGSIPDFGSVLLDDFIAPYDAAPAPVSELRGQWHLDDLDDTPALFDTADSSGNGADALAYTVGSVPGRFGSAMRTIGISFVAADATFLQPGRLTLLAWVRSDSSPGVSRTILGEGFKTDCSPASYAMYTSFAGSANAGGLEFYVTVDGQAYTAPGIGPSQVWDGAWHLVVGTFDGGAARFYLDGHQVGDGVAVQDDISYGSPLEYFRIGGYGRRNETACGVDTEYRGQIDEVRLYGRALSTDEIRELAGVPGAEPPVPGVPNPVDTTAPTTAIELDPVAPTARDAWADAATVRVSASDDLAPANVIVTRCVLDPATPPASLADLPAGCPYTGVGAAVTAPGMHTVYAASRDAVGNASVPVSRTFRIVPSPTTTITFGPPEPSWSTAPGFGYEASIAGSTFECRVDGGAWFACSSTYQTGVLSSGVHVFDVRATSPEGAVQTTPTSRPFTIAGYTTMSRSCRVSPVTHWLFTGIPGVEPAIGCRIGGRTAAGCPSGVTCVPLPQDCPPDASCLVVTKAEWRDQDRGAIQGVEALVSLGPAAVSDPMDVRGVGTAPHRESACFTAPGEDACRTATYLQVAGGRPGLLYGGCDWRPQLFGGFAGAVFGPAANRELQCTTTISLSPTATLTPFVVYTGVGVPVPGPGKLSVSFALGGAKDADDTGSAAAGVRALAAKRKPTPPPAIARIQLNVAKAGTVTLKPELNLPAKRLLKQRGRVSVRMTVVFAGAGGGPSTTSVTSVVLQQPTTSTTPCSPRVAKRVARDKLRQRLRDPSLRRSCRARS